MVEPVTWYTKFKFTVEIDGLVQAGFNKCSELGVEATNIEYYEGGRRHPHNSPGRVKFDEITLSKGATQDRELYEWFKATYNAANGFGMDTPLIYRNMEIVQRDLTNTEVQRIVCHDCYPRRFSAGDFDNDADEIRIQSVVIVADRWDLLPA